MAKKAIAAKKTASGRSAMSDEHKAALAEGREQGRAVRQYLEGLEHHRPKRGRKRTSESVGRRLEAVESFIAEAGPLDRLHLVQERLDLQAELVGMDGGGVDMTELEEAFVQAASGYGARRGITYSAWREAGVPAAVLRRAAIGRSQ